MGRCPGTRTAFNRREAFALEPHEVGRQSWGACWKCKRSLGCSTCTTSNALEILCRPCAAWGTRSAFLHHGPIIANPRVPTPAVFLEYPEEWRRAYEPPSKVGVVNLGRLVTEAVKALEAQETRDRRHESEKDWHK